MATDFDPRFDPAFQRGHESRESVVPSVVQRPTVVERPPVVELVETNPQPTQSPTHPAPAFETRGNPWLRALWVVAAIFVVGGVAAQFAAQALLQRAYSSSPIDFYVLPLSLAQLSPWFTVAGLFAGVAAIVLGAIRWRPERQ